MKCTTTRFGEIDIKESEVIVMKGPILGFQRSKQFVLLLPKENTPLWWLQSLDDPALAFVVINPCVVKPGYNPAITAADLDFIGIKNQEEIALLSIVTVRSNPFRVTANLRAPLVINASNRMAFQVVLDDPTHSIQYEIIEQSKGDSKNEHARQDRNSRTISPVNVGNADLF